jgi:hypothetical protein
MGIRITHIRKPDRDNRYEAISHYGTSDTKSGAFVVFEREWFIEWLEDNSTYAYVSEDGNTAICDIKNNGNIRFLQTRPDASAANNLLSLPPC